MTMSRAAGNGIQPGLIRLVAEEVHASVQLFGQPVGEGGIAFHRPNFGGRAGAGMHDDAGTTHTFRKQLAHGRCAAGPHMHTGLTVHDGTKRFQRF